MIAFGALHGKGLHSLLPFLDHQKRKDHRYKIENNKEMERDEKGRLKGEFPLPFFDEKFFNHHKKANPCKNPDPGLIVKREKNFGDGRKRDLVGLKDHHKFGR